MTPIDQEQQRTRMPVQTGFTLKALVLSSGVAFALLGPGVASATLGEPEASVQTDVQELRGSIKEADHGSYRGA